jgi:hypothetical protein
VGVCVFFLLGVGLRREVARRFINWISALHTYLAETAESFDRRKARVARRFKNAVVYIVYMALRLSTSAAGGGGLVFLACCNYDRRI